MARRTISSEDNAVEEINDETLDSVEETAVEQVTPKPEPVTVIEEVPPAPTTPKAGDVVRGGVGGVLRALGGGRYEIIDPGTQS